MTSKLTLTFALLLTTLALGACAPSRQESRAAATVAAVPAPRQETQKEEVKQPPPHRGHYMDPYLAARNMQSLAEKNEREALEEGLPNWQKAAHYEAAAEDWEDAAAGYEQVTGEYCQRMAKEARERAKKARDRAEHWR